MTRSRKKRILLALFLIPFVVGVVTAGAIIWDGLHDRIEPVDVAVVPGSLVYHDRPSPRLKSRLDKAASLYKKNLFGKVIVSGGIDAYGNNEAEVMKNYLVAQGVPSEQIVMDSLGNTTFLTAKNTSRIMREQHLHRAMVISQFFHISRTKLALRHFQVPCSASAHANYFDRRDVYSTMREVAGYYAYLFKS